MVLLCPVIWNAFYIGLQLLFILPEEEFHKLEYEKELQHFQNIVRKNNDAKDAKTNHDAKESSTVQSGKAISYDTSLDIRCDKISLHHKF